MDECVINWLKDVFKKKKLEIFRLFLSLYSIFVLTINAFTYPYSAFTIKIHHVRKPASFTPTRLFYFMNKITLVKW